MSDQRPSSTGLGTGSGLLLLALVAVATLGSALRRFGGLLRSLPSSGHTPLTRAVPLVLTALAVVAIATVVAVRSLRRVATRRTLAARVSYLVLPSDDFDPSEEGVLRAAGQLGRVRRAVLGWLDPEASAIRLRMDSADDGRMICRVEVAGRARSVVRAAFTSMGPVELREESPPPGPEHPPVRRGVRR